LTGEFTIEHPDRAKAMAALDEAESRSLVPISVKRARWALTVAARAEVLRGIVRSAVAAGDFRKAVRTAGILSGPNGYWSALKFGLSTPQVRNEQNQFMDDPHLFEELFRPRGTSDPLLEQELYLRRAAVADMVSMATGLLTEHPELRTAIREDPRYARVRHIYAFRVLTGLQEPISVSADVKP